MSVARRQTSIRHVAALAGVSHQTVSRVLNGHPWARIVPGTIRAQRK